MKKLLTLFCCSLLASFSGSATSENYQVVRSEIFQGYIVKKIWLHDYAMPSVQISGITTIKASGSADNIKASNPSDIKITLGSDRKRPFALVQIPAYSLQNGELRQLSEFSLTIEEKHPANNLSQSNLSQLAKTTGNASILASGSWYKIAIAQKGLYKIDYDFVKNSMKIDPSTVNTSNFRIYGNGGTMLSENNAVPRASDLTENAIWVNDGGDGVFNQGDYILFYANGPMAWDKDSVNQRFVHRKNLYEDKSYYFINFDKGPGKRVSSQASATNGNVTVTAFDDYQVHEEDLISAGKFGKEWLGEEFSNLPGKSNTHSFAFNLGNVIEPIKARIYLASASRSSSNTFTISLNGAQVDQYTLDAVKGDDASNPITFKSGDYQVPATSYASFQIDYQPTSPDGKGYLNYIELNTRRSLSFSGGAMTFRDWRSVGPNKVANYQLTNANGNVNVWDITDPLNPIKINGSLNGNTYSFSQNANQLHEFLASDGSQYLAPEYIGTVNNQNLHGNGQTDFLIITHPNFVDAANKLADFHRQHDNMRVTVSTVQDIYNEFSSGSQDISAIRDYAKMFYDRAGADSTQMPRYMLLFGDASYDYKNRINANTNFVPTFESAESVIFDNGFPNDDFFGFLDANENIEDVNIANTLDVGVGRIPVQTATDANGIVDKIIRYKSPASLGPWRLSNTFIADNEDGAGEHLAQADEMCAEVNAQTNIYNATKVYIDNLPFISTPGGSRCPDANKAINDQVYKGTFLINYSGHGNIYTLADERVLTADDFNSWKNIDKLPIMITATCDFSRFDDPAYSSAGERLIMKNNGGAIALLTTTQATFAGNNKRINKDFLDAQFTHIHGTWNSFGDAFRKAKNNTYATAPGLGTIVNFRKFTLLGDPALEPNFPKYFVKTHSVKNFDNNNTDSISALGGYTISGKVEDADGNQLNNFNGRLYVTIYDKPETINLTTKATNASRSYQSLDNIIYKGKATVTNGEFSFKFIAPKDLNYDYGKGRISYYAENGETDAAGTDTTMTVGGYSDNPVVDNDGPQVKAYMNDSLFIDGSITGSNTLLYVKLFDQTGINISGNGVGHDLTAILDGDIQHPYTLNDYYETAPNDYQRGYVKFPIAGLANGKHNFRVKAWDVNNNSGEGEVNFEVVDGNIVRIANLMNYPNPFSDVTHFIFDHNHPDEALDVKIMIYNTAGSLVRKLEDNYTPSGSRSFEITWDGTDNSGAKLPSGIYVYKINLATEKGNQETAYQKLVLIR